MSAGTIATFLRFGNQIPVAIPLMVFSVMLGNIVLTDVPTEVPANNFIGAMQAIFLIFLALAVTGIVCSVVQEKEQLRG